MSGSLDAPILTMTQEPIQGGLIPLAKHQVSISSDAVRWESLSAPGRQVGTVAFCDLLGCSVAGTETASPKLVLHCFPKGKAGCFCGGASKTRTRRDHELPCSFAEQAISACAAIRQALGQGTSPRRFLVLVNPYGGGGKAAGVWRKLEPLLALAHIEAELITTTHQGHGREVAAAVELGKYSALVTVSGDGLLNEVLNGLMSRADSADALAQLPIAPAPGGTGNGLHQSICFRAGEANDAVGTAFVLAKGRPAPLDLWEYMRPASADGEVPSEHIMWSFLSFAWGIISDVDLESETLRSFGALRNTIYGLLRVAFLRRYTARLTYLDATTDSWQTLEASDWIGLWACNVSHMSQTDWAAPEAEFDNGVLDVLALTGGSKLSTLKMFLDIEEGKHLKEKSLKLLKVKAFRLFPEPRTSSKPGLLDVDGELVLPYGPIEARRHGHSMHVLLP
jgi:sphingosine kinase